METGTAIFVSQKRWKINKKYNSWYLKVFRLRIMSDLYTF